MSFFDYILPFDLSILEFIQNTLRCAFLDFAMAFFSYMGEGGIVWIAIAVFLLFGKKTRMTGIMVLCALLLGLLAGEVILKNLIARPRPFIANPEIVPLISPPSGFSFPSGHSCSSFAAATTIALKHKKAAVLTLLLAFMIAFSRLYNCVHYPSDVLAGILLGIISAIIIAVIFNSNGFNRFKEKIINKFDKRRE